MRESREPRLSDLRESGAIEQDADLVLFLWREREKPGDEGEIDGEVVNLRLAKHRNGPTGEVKLWFKQEPDPLPELRRRALRRSRLKSGGRADAGGRRTAEGDRPGARRSGPTLPSIGRRRLARNGRSSMGVIIVREMVGMSPHSWSDAARQAVALASKTVRNIRTVEVVQSTARVEGGEIVEYRVQMKLGFEYEE